MNKVYSRIFWKNYPSEDTPLNEKDLNQMDLGIDNLDNRLVEMDAVKVNKEIANTLVKNWSIDENTGIITVEKLNGEKILFDLNIEKIPVNFELSKEGILTMITDDGSKFTANIGAMIPVLTFEDSDEIAVTVSGEGVNKTYSFSIKAGAVTEDKLQPNFLADVKTEVAKAQASQTAAADKASAASNSAALAESYTHGGTGAREGEDTDNAKYYMDQAKSVSKVDIATKDMAGISKPGEGLEIDTDGAMNVSKEIMQHPDKTINSEEGVHGLREWDEKLEYFDGENWIEIKTGGSSIGVGDVIGASITSSSRQATLKWTDPNDIEVSGAPIATWAGTKLIRKEGSSPESISDGVVVVDNTEKNKYSSEGYTDTGLENGTTYYYRFFTYTTENVVTAGTSLNVTPGRIAIATIPIQSGTLTYDGINKTPSWSNYDSNKMEIGGTTSATNAGTYTATFTPKEDYCWSDGSVAAKSVAWTINKASGSVTLSSTNVELNPTYTSRTVTVSDATGTVSVSSNDTSVATASISGNTITINSESNTSGSAIITVSVASSANYNTTSKTISVTASFVLDGETATPVGDVQTWLKCDSTGRAMQQGADITTLAEVIANSDVLGYLMADESAMKYLARSTGFAEEACASETFMTALGASSWVDGTILNSDIWVEAICNSQYMDKVLNDLVPAMTSNTSSVGTAYVSPNSNEYAPYMMFDKNLTTYSGTPIYSNYPHYYGMNFNINKKIYAIRIPANDGYSPKDCILQISDNGSDWKDIKQFTVDNTGSSNNLITFSPVYTKYIRIKANNGYYTKYNWSGIYEWYIYGR